MQLTKAKEVIEKLKLNEKIILSKSIGHIQGIFPEYTKECGMNVLKIIVDNSIKRINAKEILAIVEIENEIERKIYEN